MFFFFLRYTLPEQTTILTRHEHHTNKLSLAVFILASAFISRSTIENIQVQHFVHLFNSKNYL